MRTWLILVLLLMAPLAPASEQTDAAVASSAGWLRQLDQGEYAAAYGSSGSLMREEVPFETWRAAIEQARQPLGQTVKRELTYGALEKVLPGLARGQYAQLRFRTAFANREAVTEHVTLMLEDEQWRTIGYFIQ